MVFIRRCASAPRFFALLAGREIAVEVWRTDVAELTACSKQGAQCSRARRHRFDRVEDRSINSIKKVCRFRVVGLLVVASTITLMGACGGNCTGPKISNLIGTHNLTTINRSTLPYTVPHTGENVGVIRAGNLSLDADSVYLVSADGTVNGTHRAFLLDGGVYSVSATQVIFRRMVVEGEQHTSSIAGKQATNSP
jgi:hypothetical protein